ncbi:MAG TPA: hypothetical protein VGZ02_00115 [Candidatus Baltobacteraceae bacterium]|jgi:predicted Zn-dependent peptidase|nr:hypothetical protein [Candidatus Baltobacteraceae bacterium]
MKRFIVALLAAALIGVGSAPSRAATVVQQPDASAELIGLEVLVQAGLDRQTVRQNGLAALVAESILQTPVDGSPLKEAVAAGGGSVAYTVEARDVRFYLEGLTASYPHLLDLFQRALDKPDFGAKTLASARTALDARIGENQHIALNVGIEMLNRAFYSNSNAGMPPNGLPETLASFDESDAQQFYAAHYRSGEAVVSVVGNAQALPVSRYTTLAASLGSGSSAPVSAATPPLPSTSHQLIARRDVPVPWLVAQYPAPDLRSKDFGAMLVLTAFIQRTLSDVSGVPGLATQTAAQRGVGAFYNFDTHPANVVFYVDGGLGDPTRTFATALTIVNVLGHAKLSGDLQEMKSFAAGRFLEDTTTLEDRAWLGGVFASARVSGDYRLQVVKAIDATNSDDLQRVAARYLGAPTIALVLPRAVQAGTPSTP